MATNRIEIYQHNTRSIGCVIGGGPADLSTYIPYFTVKSRASGSTSIITSTGSVTDASTLSFSLSSTDTSVDPGNYVYDITIENGTTIYTVVKDSFIVLEAVKY